jgi:hypothetical protein
MWNRNRISDEMAKIAVTKIATTKASPRLIVAHVGVGTRSAFGFGVLVLLGGSLRCWLFFHAFF